MKSNNNTANVAETINDANKKQTSQALIISAYANSVNEQPTVDFSGETKLADFGKNINDKLRIAQTHADTYLYVIQPSILKNIASIGNYYALHDAVCSVLPEGSTEAQWVEVLTALDDQSKSYQTDANGVVTTLQTLSSDLNTDAASFAGIVTKLNAAVDGDNGVLSSISDQLDTIQGQIDGAIAATVLSGLAIAGGIFVVCVGGIADFVTVGASTPIVAGGVAIVSAGIGGEIASALTLKNLNNEKATLLTQQANLKAEVKLATGISSGYQALKNQVRSAVTAASSMSNAWLSLSADLGSLINDLEKGIKNAGVLRELFLTAANTTIKTVIADIKTIKTQMAGVQDIVAEKGQTVGDAIVNAVQEKRVALAAAPAKMLVKDWRRFLLRADGAGVLSQSVENLNVAEGHIRSITNLPGSAQRIQNQSLANFPLIITNIQALQSKVGVFVNSTNPELKTIEAMLTSNQSLEDIKTAVEKLCDEASALTASATQALTTIRQLISTMYGYFNQLASIQKGLTSQRTNLEGQLGEAQGRENAAKQKYYYLIALGPFGLIGLVVALALYEHIKSEVNGYERQISGLNSQISSLNVLKKTTGQLGNEFRNVISKVTSVKNTVSFVSNDILQIRSDMALGETRIVIEIAIKAAKTEMKILSIDAS